MKNKAIKMISLFLRAFSNFCYKIILLRGAAIYSREHNVELTVHIGEKLAQGPQRFSILSGFGRGA